MKAGYVDTSCLVAIAFGERGSAKLARRLAGYDVLISSHLLEAELRSAFALEEVGWAEDIMAGLSWVLPDRTLGSEMERALEAGYLRGADLWHVACALFVAPDPSELDFITLDEKQRDVVERLGFA